MASPLNKHKLYTFSLLEGQREAMRRYPEQNWSRLVQRAIQRKLKQLEKDRNGS